MAGKIFISYARVDEQAVRQIYDALKTAGYNPWLDVEDILPGENWKWAINRAIENTDFFIAVLSQNSVDRRGVIQKEIRTALDKMEEFLPDDLFIIPVRLDDCGIPERLVHLHVLDWEAGKGKDRLLKAIRVGLEMRGEAAKPAFPASPAENSSVVKETEDAPPHPEILKENQAGKPEGKIEQETAKDVWGRVALLFKSLSPQIWAAIIAALATIITAVFGYLEIVQPKQMEIRATQTAEARHTASALTETAAVIKATITPILPLTATPNSALTNTRWICPFPSGSDDEILELLINREGKLVENTNSETLEERMQAIREMFTSDAQITDHAGPWAASVYDVYEGKFQNEQHRNIQHMIMSTIYAHNNTVAIVELQAFGEYYLDGDWRGYGPIDDPNGPSWNRWTFEKIDGCWRITSVEYNINLTSPTPKP